jgi:hypothetical protein
MQTAMQEMLEWTRKTFPMDLDTPRLIEDKVQELLEKEKEQIIDAWIATDNELRRLSAEKYYNQTYNQNK